MYPLKKIVNTLPRFWITNRKVDEWFYNKNIFFILSIGRSGTQFLSNLLNLIPRACVEHEPVTNDFRSYQGAFYSEKKAYLYIKYFRKKEIYLRVKDKNINSYGEVNSVLRRHSKALRELIPNVKILHLVRDGRDVVRSGLSRKTMTTKDRITRNIRPSKGDPWYDEWKNMNRFERICWYWDVENRYLNKNIENTIRFEELISDFDYFEEILVKNLNLKISKDIWQKEILIPKNVSQEYKVPHWKKWDQNKKDSFLLICGETMKKLGYDTTF